MVKGDTVIVVSDNDSYIRRSELKIGDVTTITEVGGDSIRVSAPNSDGNWWILKKMFKLANPTGDGGWETP